jgi:hypothetical protein
MIDKSETLAALFAALAKVQGAMKPALKDSDNPFFKSKYADLSAVGSAAFPHLSANGLSVVQIPGECGDKRISLSTILGHSSGEWISGEMTIPLAKFDPQAHGSALTYARRYALGAFVGVLTDDDDGNAASRPASSAMDNDAPTKAKPLLGPYKSKTALWAAIKGFDHELRGCGDTDMLEAFLATKESKELIEQTKRDASSLWDGIGGNLPDGFEPLERVIQRLRDDFQAIDQFNEKAQS